MLPHRSIVHLPLVLAAFFSASCSLFSLAVDDPDPVLERSLVSGGRSRTYLVHLPRDHDGRGLPLVIIMHGGGGSAEGIRLFTGFDATADEMGFVVAYPNATTDWAEGCGCSQADRNGIDDVQFMSDLIDAVEGEFGIDRSHVYTTGFSQGGLMAYKLACDFADGLAAVAAVGASMAVPLAESCSPARHLPLIVMLGTEDPYFPWAGAYDRELESVLSADSTVSFWAAANGCVGDRSSELEFTGELSGVEVWREWYPDCAVGREVLLYRLENAGHIWPQGGYSASWVIGNFFRSH
jgi:polyhydroxybutyrate depolymerase